MVRRFSVILGGVALAAILIGSPIIVFEDRYMERYRTLEKEYTEVLRENRELERGVEELRRFITNFRNDERFREKVVREELGYIRDGEVIYRLPSSPRGRRSSRGAGLHILPDLPDSPELSEKSGTTVRSGASVGSASGAPVISGPLKMQRGRLD